MNEPTIEERSVARLVLFDSGRRMLLFRHTDGYGQEFWATPGGGLEPGETFEEAARREAAEELGAEKVELTPLWTRHAEFLFANRKVSQDEVYYLVTDCSPIPVPSVGEVHRREGIIDVRWWSLDEIEHSHELIFPPDLAASLREHLASTAS